MEVWRLAGDTDCYVTYPRAGGVFNRQRTWYEARNKCLRLNGDLATIKITSSDELDWLEKNVRYWIGLQRDPLMMSLPGTWTNDRYCYVSSGRDVNLYLVSYCLKFVELQLILHSLRS